MLRFSILATVVAGLIVAGCSQKKSETEYFQAGYDHYNKEKHEEAIGNFENVLKYYPEGTNAAKSMFMIGFIHANHTKNLELAKEYYTKFIAKYPQHELVASAKYELETLGKDINELDIFDKIEKEGTTSGE